MSKIKIEFCIVGDSFPHAQLTELLNITPKEAYYKDEIFLGGPNKDVPMKRKECCWCIETEYIESIDVTVELRKIYNILKHKKNELIEIANTYPVTCFFVIVIYYGGDNPILGIEKEIVKFAGEIGAEFVFDTYV